MGRFFQAQPVELAKGNMYQAPYELMAMANAKAEANLQQDYDDTEVLKETDRKSVV